VNTSTPAAEWPIDAALVQKLVSEQQPDLACVWMLLNDRSSRERAIASYAPDQALLNRARGWAVLFGCVLLETGMVDHLPHATMGAQTLRNVAAGP
jgi:hypothetical protein